MFSEILTFCENMNTLRNCEKSLFGHIFAKFQNLTGGGGGGGALTHLGFYSVKLCKCFRKNSVKKKFQTDC